MRLFKEQQRTNLIDDPQPKVDSRQKWKERGIGLAPRMGDHPRGEKGKKHDQERRVGKNNDPENQGKDLSSEAGDEEFGEGLERQKHHRSKQRGMADDEKAGPPLLVGHAIHDRQRQRHGPEGKRQHIDKQQETTHGVTSSIPTVSGFGTDRQGRRYR